ncbi:MAG: hypothetical protein J0L88_13095, partial [Xanthomonadales bacterium]|nr:hypothetical protein [Xanthomonadales bacterium]
TATCEQQAFRYAHNAYGFQFHLEADPALIERWLGLPAYRDELVAAGFGASLDAIRARSLTAAGPVRDNADAVFNGFLDLVGRPARLLGAADEGRGPAT